jgi:hypothetical protein
LRLPVEPPKMAALLAYALSPDEYEPVLSAVRHEKMSALAATGKQVPVNELKLEEYVQAALSPSELATLQAAEQEAAVNAARAAMQMEKLLEKGVALSDDLVMGCQRGDADAMAELDALVQAHLSAEEMRVLHEMEEAVLEMMSGDGGGEGGHPGIAASGYVPDSGFAGGGGGEGANAGMAASGRPGYVPDSGFASGRIPGKKVAGTLTQEEASLAQESSLLEMQEKMQSEYLARLSESSVSLRNTLQSDLDKEQKARREAQARNLALLDAVENQRARNAELMAKVLLPRPSRLLRTARHARLTHLSRKRHSRATHAPLTRHLRELT